MKRFSLLLAVLLLPTSLALGDTVVFKGLTFNTIGDGTAAIDGSGNLVLTRGTTDFYVVADLTSTGINDNLTPWIEASYIDPGASDSKKIDIFIEDSGPVNQRLQAGSLFSFEGLGYERYQNPAIESVVFVEGAGTRVAGDAHTIYAGKRVDGTVDYTFDGTEYTGTFLKDSGVGAFSFMNLYLRSRGGVQGDTFVFTDLKFGDDNGSTAVVPLPASAWGGIALLGLVVGSKLIRRKATVAC